MTHSTSTSSIQGISSNPNHVAPPNVLRINPNEWLVPGEEVKLEDSNVSLVYAKDAKIAGRVYVTNYRLRFESDNPADADKILNATLGSISKVAKWGRSSVKVSDELYGLLITCKDARGLFFEHRRENHSRRALYESLQLNAFPLSNKLPFFATVYSQNSRTLHPSTLNGWMLFDTEREFQRQRLPTRLWSITRINANYAFCPTYPAILAVPTAVVSKVDGGEKFLKGVAKYRSKCRIPVLSWIDHRTGAAIVRSAQPMFGLPPKKLEQDEQYLKMIIDANENCKNLVILDARPEMNARANAVKGGGYESYPACEQVEFLDIQNIHVVRKSLNALKEACYPVIKMKSFNKKLHRTKWLDHLKTILNGSIKVVTEITIRRNSVLVHCSDGWDRTAQLTSLAMLQLDPYYRTLEGFAVLIEKEWNSFGHKFSQRFGHGEDKHEDEERAPIFVQFIDCVWQLYNQFTSSFEFNSLFLRTILDELYACRYGTFLYNAEKERRDQEVKKNTVSLWTYVLENREKFLNGGYEPPNANSDPLAHCLNTVSHRPHVHFWSEYYCQHNLTVIPSGSEQSPSTPSTSWPSTSRDGSVNLPMGSSSCYELNGVERHRSPSDELPTRSESLLLKRKPEGVSQTSYAYFSSSPSSYSRRPSEPAQVYNTRL